MTTIIDDNCGAKRGATEGSKDVIKRSSGVLMHISSLPGSFETGTMGNEANQFIRHLSKMGCTYWQILPLYHLSEIRSPYSSRSLFALNPAFIDIHEFRGRGLLTMAEIEEGTSIDDSKTQAESAPIMEKKRLVLMRKAFTRLSEADIDEVRAFAERNRDWIDDYALFCALKNAFDGRRWYEWMDIGLRLHKEDAIDKARELYKNDILFWKFIQFTAYSQWTAIKACANSFGVKVIGDMPIYAAFDSSDAWARSELFQLNTKHMPKQVAGVPPDYFNKNGQLWGNPLYDWEHMRKDGYAWWMSRMEHALALYDVVRIDHYRGFHSFWSVPFANKTAKKGDWEKGPGMDFVKCLKARFPNAPIVVEDLGDLDEDVKKFLDESDYPGMRVMQFGFGEDGTPEHRVKNFTDNCVAYTGTHDNSTVAGWYEEVDEDTRIDSYKELGLWKPNKRKTLKADPDGADSPTFAAKDLCRAWIEALFMSDASVAIVPIQDLLCKGNESRMNWPGTESFKNWSYRVKAEELDSIDIKWVRTLNTASKRNSFKEGGDAASAAASDS